MIDAVAVRSCVGLSNRQLRGLNSLGSSSFAMLLQILHQSLQLVVAFIWLHLKQNRVL